MSFDAAIFEIKRALSDPLTVCRSLGFLAGPKGSWVRQSQGILVRCPAHSEKTPSCSVQRKGSGLLWKCHGCDAGGDVLSFVATVRGLDVATEFRTVLIESAVTAQLHALVTELERGEVQERPRARATLSQESSLESERPYPPLDDVKAFWSECGAIAKTSDSGFWLSGRGLDPERIFASGLAKEIWPRTKLPTWASFRGSSWRETGHTLIVPMFDADGTPRSVRASRVLDGETPKRLPPGGHRASGLVMADELALAMLRGTWKPERIVISEGEPDWLSASTRIGITAHAHLGIVSGSWTSELAAKIPSGATVYIRTDNDGAGDRYATLVGDSLEDRCTLRRKSA